MAKKDRTTGMKSAWELAEERMAKTLGEDSEGRRSLTDADKAQLAECRKAAEAKLAELEILEGNPLADPMASPAKKEAYLRERRFIEQTRDEKLDAIRKG